MGWLGLVLLLQPDETSSKKRWALVSVCQEDLSAPEVPVFSARVADLARALMAPVGAEGSSPLVAGRKLLWPLVLVAVVEFEN